MKKNLRFSLLSSLVLFAVASSALFSPSSADDSGAAVRVLGTMQQLKQGDYNGTLQSRELLNYGDTGIGTFDRLDGEMIVTEGQVWQVKSDGTIQRAEDTTALFASVNDSSSQKSIDLRSSTSFAALGQMLDRMFSPDEILALKMHGEFAFMRTRSVPPQSKPYPPLAEVITQQTVFENKNVRGEIVGYRTPVSAENLTGSGYHFHFLSGDRTVGGHVLDFTLASGTAEISLVNTVEPFPQ